ncbi:DNA polymerase III subunit chi [Paracoccus sp. (in: a-proteobacteria)]|uniref:DNA polymerase III subunit chi n=1 Tax=Paracoccus sp. TaxID=267 RepID=UPI0028A21B4D|nr:DNA polymerase III subunit chi [Paracoccus sp. (in: a-proteobacteria)]
MGAALFYHLTRSAPEALLPILLSKSLAAGWRVELRSAHRGALERLDESLWQGDGFLPHGLAGGPFDAQQPVLLTQNRQEGVNQPSCLMVVHGAEVTPEDCRPLERSCILFDGNDPEALDRARAQWRLLTQAGIEAQYWSEASGRWERKQ